MLFQSSIHTSAILVLWKKNPWCSRNYQFPATHRTSSDKEKSHSVVTKKHLRETPWTHSLIIYFWIPLFTYYQHKICFSPYFRCYCQQICFSSLLSAQNIYFQFYVRNYYYKKKIYLFTTINSEFLVHFYVRHFISKFLFVQNNLFLQYMYWNILFRSHFLKIN